MNILHGFYQPDEGEICIQDQPAKITSPHDAIKKGVGMVHQHFMLALPLAVTENIMFGQYCDGVEKLERKTVQIETEAASSNSAGVA